MIDISTENRLREIAANLKKDVKELLSESARIVTGIFKRGYCTARGADKGWKRFTNGIPNIAKTLNDINPFVFTVLPEQQPFVTVRESNIEDFPTGTRMTLSEAEQRIGDLNESLWDSDEPDREIKVEIDYRMDDEQDRYCLPVVIGPGQSALLAQMRRYVEAALKNPDIVCQEFYSAPAGLNELLHEYFGPQLHKDLERLGTRVLSYFEQHCTISRLEQQFEKQAQAIPMKDQLHFRKSAQAAIAAMRRTTNTGQAIFAPQRTAPEQTAPEVPSPSLDSDTDQKPRRSVKVQLCKIKEARSPQPSIQRTRNDPQR